MKTRKKESQSEQVERLSRTECGRALRDLIYGFDSQAALANRLGLRPAQITQWVAKGRVSMMGAELIEQKIGTKKELMRPDVEDWSKPEPGRRLSQEADRTGTHQLAIADLVSHFGSVARLASALDTTNSAINKWSHRNRIPYRKICELREMNIPGLQLDSLQP